MKILHYIHYGKSFPVIGYGGGERIAYWLGKAQAELGHEVIFLCRNPNNVPVSFAKVVKAPEEFDDLTPYVPEYVDIVHLHDTPNFKLKKPFLVTMHGNGKKFETYHPNTVFVSANHAARHNWTEYVHNAVDLSEYPIASDRSKENYVLFLAKAAWIVKNLPGAIRIAKAAGKELHIAGGKAPFWCSQVTSYGTVGGLQKLELLQKAQVFLFPIIWEEPFGVAAIEALACGTPVVATRRGALPEIVDSTCGFLCDSFDEFVEALNSANSFEPEICRKRVEEKFTHVLMGEKYISYYRKVLKDGYLRDGYPKATMNQRGVNRYKQKLPHTFLDYATAIYLKEF